MPPLPETGHHTSGRRPGWGYQILFAASFVFDSVRKVDRGLWTGLLVFELARSARNLKLSSRLGRSRTRSLGYVSYNVREYVHVRAMQVQVGERKCEPLTPSIHLHPRKAVALAQHRPIGRIHVEQSLVATAPSARTQTQIETHPRHS